MILQNIYRIILRRQLFKGQDRVFNFLFTRKKLYNKNKIAKPIQGHFKINCDTSTWIGAKIYYTGNYEPALKRVFKRYIKKGDYVVDVGANIGFHTLFFAELVSDTGSVIAFEPVPYNFESLKQNIALNNYSWIRAENLALGDKNETLTIKADSDSQNPGTFNLFDRNGDIHIDCRIGDELLLISRVDFIKIDVEGYESFVIDGLMETIKRYRPKIVFEYDKEYHQKTDRPENYIFLKLADLNYHFLHIYNEGLVQLERFENLKSGNILALPNA